MSSTSDFSSYMLLIPKRAEKHKLSWTEFKILMAIDKHGGSADRQKIEQSIGRSLNGKNVRCLSEKSFLEYQDVAPTKKKVIYSYTLTPEGENVLSLILNGKEAA